MAAVLVIDGFSARLAASFQVVMRPLKILH
jgi:hypothetical protein